MLSARTVIPAAVTGIALLGSCAQFDWHKTGATVELRDRDTADCTARARIEAIQRMPIQSPPGTHVVVDSLGRAVTIQSPRRDDERFLIEQDVMRACMHERGYILQNRTTQAP